MLVFYTKLENYAQGPGFFQDKSATILHPKNKNKKTLQDSTFLFIQGKSNAA